MIVGASKTSICNECVKLCVEILEEDIEYIDRKRLSKLTYSGHKKISRIERKSAIIAFSAEEVYAIAELIRRQKLGLVNIVTRDETGNVSEFK